MVDALKLRETKLSNSEDLVTKFLEVKFQLVVVTDLARSIALAFFVLFKKEKITKFVVSAARRRLSPLACLPSDQSIDQSIN